MRTSYLTGITEGRRRYGSLKNENSSEDAQDFISKAIKKHIDEGMPQDQAEAVAFKEAREKGYKVPANENDDRKIMTRCDECGKSFYDVPEGSGLCPDCKKKKSNENSKCPVCKDDMDQHDSTGRCEACGNQCG